MGTVRRHINKSITAPRLLVMIPRSSMEGMEVTMERELQRLIQVRSITLDQSATKMLRSNATRSQLKKRDKSVMRNMMLSLILSTQKSVKTSSPDIVSRFIHRSIRAPMLLVMILTSSMAVMETHTIRERLNMVMEVIMVDIKDTHQNHNVKNMWRRNVTQGSKTSMQDCC